MLAQEATRETFANLPIWAIAFWYFLIFLSTGILFYGIYRLARKYRQGRGPAELDRPARRSRRGRRRSSSPTRGSADATRCSGFAHLFVFYGFLVLFVGTAILAFQDDVAGPLGFEFFKGWFYKAYSLFLDVFGAMLVVGLIVLAVKRGIMRPFRLDYWRPDREPGEPGWNRARYVRGDWLFLGLLFFLALSGFLLEAFRIAETNPPFETWSPIGWVVGQGFTRHRLRGRRGRDGPQRQLVDPRRVALGFVASIPFTKAVHMIAGPRRRRGARREARPLASRRSRPTRSPTRSATSGSPILRRGICSISTPARSAASAMPPARRRPPGTRSRRAT